MSPRIKKIKILSYLLVIIIFFACSKSASEKGAGEAVGSYTGIITIVGTSNNHYNDYVVKIEHPSKDKIKVSCVSTPQVFDSFETTVSLANGTITSYGSANDVFCQPSVGYLSLNVLMGGNTILFSGYK